MRIFVYSMCWVLAFCMMPGCGGDKDKKQASATNNPVTQTTPRTETPADPEPEWEEEDGFGGADSLRNGLFPQPGAGTYPVVFNSTGTGGGLFPQRGTEDRTQNTSSDGGSNTSPSAFNAMLNAVSDVVRGNGSGEAGSPPTRPIKQTSEFGELYDKAGELFQAGEGEKALDHVYAYMLSNDEALGEFPMKWHATIKRPRVALRWGVGVVRGGVADERAPVIGEPVEDSDDGDGRGSSRGGGRGGDARGGGGRGGDARGGGGRGGDARGGGGRGGDPRGGGGRGGIPAPGGGGRGGAVNFNGASGSEYEQIDASTPMGLLLHYTGDFGEQLVNEFDKRRVGKAHFGRVLKDMPGVLSPAELAAANVADNFDDGGDFIGDPSGGRGGGRGAGGGRDAGGRAPGGRGAGGGRDAGGRGAGGGRDAGGRATGGRGAGGGRDAGGRDAGGRDGVGRDGTVTGGLGGIPAPGGRAGADRGGRGAGGRDAGGRGGLPTPGARGGAERGGQDEDSRDAGARGGPDRGGRDAGGRGGADRGGRDAGGRGGADRGGRDAGGRGGADRGGRDAGGRGGADRGGRDAGGRGGADRGGRDAGGRGATVNPVGGGPVASDGSLATRWAGNTARSPRSTAVGELSPGLIGLGEGSRDEIAQRAQENNVDCLLLIQINGAKRRGTLSSMTRLRLVDAQTAKKKLAETSNLSNQTVMKARADGKKDQVADQLSKFFEDEALENLRGADMPTMSSEVVLKRVNSIVEAAENPLRDSVEVIWYYREGLLPEDEAIRAIDSLLDGIGEVMINGSEKKREAALKDLLG